MFGELWPLHTPTVNLVNGDLKLNFIYYTLFLKWTLKHRYIITYALIHGWLLHSLIVVLWSTVFSYSFVYFFVFAHFFCAYAILINLR